MASHAVTGLAVVDASSVSHEVAEIRVRDGNNVSRSVFSLTPPLSASATPSTVYGFSSGSGTATTDAATTTPAGGTPPYTYAWDTFDGPVPPTANSPAAAATTFTQTSMLPGDSYSATWICEVTDADGATAFAYVSSFWNN